MTRRARRQMDKNLRRAIARLMHLHHETHPDRVARRLNVTPQRVREISKVLPLEAPSTVSEALEVLAVLRSPPPASPAQSSRTGPMASQSAY
jgi:DNA-directed RNA polymerase sigma subunit (sigma70/sigma32)